MDNSDNETGFKIERSLTSGSGFAIIGTVEAGVTTFSDTGLPASSIFYYRVAATNSVGASPYSSVVAGTTVPPPPPSAPASLIAAVGVGARINLTWTDTATNETGFKLQRKTGAGGTYAQIAAFAANATNYSDIGLSGSTTYYYRLSATNLGGDSAFSNETNATTPVIGNVTLTGGDGSGSSSFDTAGNWSNAQAPSATNDYFTGANTLRTPHNASGNVTFDGNSLSIDSNGSLLQKGVDQSSVTIAVLKLNGGTIRNGWGSTTQTIYGSIRVTANSILDPDNSTRYTVLAAPLSGSGNLRLISSEGPGGVVQLSGTNDAFTGNWAVSSTNTLQVGIGGASGSLGSGNVTNGGRLIFNRSDVLTVGNRISGAGTLIMNGAGTLTLAGTNTYTGATEINNGTVLVNGTLGNTAVTVGFGATLGGNGVMSGAVSVPGGFAPGANGIGKLTISNSLTLAGGATFEINKSVSPSNDLAIVTGALNAGGVLTVNNLGGALDQRRFLPVVQQSRQRKLFQRDVARAARRPGVAGQSGGERHRCRLCPAGGRGQRPQSRQRHDGSRRQPDVDVAGRFLCRFAPDLFRCELERRRQRHHQFAGVQGDAGREQLRAGHAGFQRQILLARGCGRHRHFHKRRGLDVCHGGQPDE